MPPKDAPAKVVAAYRQAWTERSSRRICVERTIAEHKHCGRCSAGSAARESFGQTYLAVVGLVSDRAARR